MASSANQNGVSLTSSVGALNSSSNPRSAHHYVTEIKVEEFSFTWTVKNFSFCERNNGEALDSPTFSVGSSEKSTLRLELKPRVKDNHGYEYISLKVRLLFSKRTELSTKVRFYIINAKGEKFGDKYEHMAHNLVWEGTVGIERFMTLNDLLQRSKDLLPDDNLTIFCEGAVTTDAVDVSGFSTRFPTDILQCTLVDSLGLLFENPKFSDCTLSVGGKNLFVHKAILAARCSVFAAMFEHDMEESQRNRVDVADVEYEVLEEMLVYVYTGKSRNMEKMADRLFVAADKYDLGGLRAMCEATLCSTLDVGNVVDLLAFAEKYGAKQLKAHAFQYMNLHIKAVMLTPAWKDMVLTNPHLILGDSESLSTS